ncbi:MAG TPA: nicotinate-nucleotide adenylyltransferase [Acidimicrobiia bacterium]|nr:nicotinate-nucleotide adenylyltransferase [Acidimicrobiia bacterium]
MPASRTERLGILGGTFDPVHVAHLVAALEARAQLALDRVLVVVAGDPWQKRGDVVASAEDRYAMVAAALEGVDGLEASRVEIERAGPTYTADTLHALADDDRALFLIVGSDVATRLDSWERADEVRRLATLAVVTRADEPVRVPPGDWRVETVRMPRLDISSTDIRARVAAGLPIDYLVPAGAVRVLRRRRLYTPG